MQIQQNRMVDIAAFDKHALLYAANQHKSFFCQASLNGVAMRVNTLFNLARTQNH